VRANYLAAFNNNGVSNNKSSVDMFAPPYDGYNYLHTPGSAYAPSTFAIRHECNGHTNSEGGAQNLPNGNILVCISQSGFIYEIDSNNNVLWSKNISGNSSNARRYTKCYVEGTLVDAPVISQQDDTLVSSYGVTYQWYRDGIPLTGSNEYYLVPPGSGTYQVSITDTGGCESELSDPFEYEMSGLFDQTHSTSMKVYPVPTNGRISLDQAIPLEDIGTILIFDLSGRPVMECLPARSYDISSLEDGIYFIVAMKDRHPIFSAKIILIR
jgi:hypothetical protein